jgi:hypothetical protein
MRWLRRLRGWAMRKRTVTHSLDWHDQQMRDTKHAEQQERRRQKLRSVERMRRADLAREVFEQQERRRHMRMVEGSMSV